MHLLKFKIFAVTALVSVFFLHGCGWHLSGLQALPPELQSLHLRMTSENSKFARALKRSFKAMEVNLADSATNAPYTLSVSDVRKERRVLSTTGAAKVAEYMLTSQITYSINNSAGEKLVEPTVLSIERTYLYNASNAVGSYEEESLLREEMQRDLIQQLIRRYRGFNPAKIKSAEAK